ncbi:MAG: hypothetical protein KC733_12425, partial [Candidatus Omnitrophica bacterium]|nr:hypothetical protein [Candidatus Omnitrophota bacterium]
MFWIKGLILIACTQFWRMGGTKLGSWWRDVLIPIIIGAYIGFETTWWIGLISVGTFNIIRLGYGIPSHDDEGSLIGRFFYNKLRLDIPWLVRGVVGAIYGLWGLLPYVIYTRQI